MKKIFLHGLLIVASFVLTLALFRQVDWIKLFRIEQATSKTEQKLGEMFWELFSHMEKENTDSIVVVTVDSLVDRICRRNGIERSKIKVHILDNQEVNAFALPDGYLVIYTGLISACKHQDELAGVIAHEVAHIELDHVMKKLMKEFGLSALVSITTGHGGPGTVQETAKMLSSTAFDRKLERAADIKAVDYLLKAGIHPGHFADFLRNMTDAGSEIEVLSWISTHPESEERAEYILQVLENRNPPEETDLNSTTWEKVQEALRPE